MNFLRKMISFIVLVLSVAGMVITCMGSGMKTVWQAFGKAFSPFDLQGLSSALSLFMVAVGFYIVLIVVSFIGLTIPKVKKDR